MLCSRPRKNMDRDLAFGCLEQQFSLTFKTEQKTIIRSLVEKRDVFAILPTGYGKSLCYAAVPLLLDKLKPDDHHVAIVVSPLVSLIRNQVEVWRKRGVDSVSLSHNDLETVQKIKDGKVSIVFTTPESLTNDSGRDLLCTLRKKICLIAYDEAHCIHEWGCDFRPKYRDVADIRSLACGVPVAAFTATCTQEIVDDVTSLLLMDGKSLVTVAILPDRPNLRFEVIRTSCYSKELKWYVDLLSRLRKDAPKLLIFCRSVSHAADIYAHLMFHVGDAAWLSTTGTKDPKQRTLDIFHKSSPEKDKARIISEFVKCESVIRCVVCTVAFGMGVDIPDLRYIVHWGCSQSPLAYWQEVGRCARDGEPGTCYLYIAPYSLNPKRVDEKMMEICKSNMCVRLGILKYLTVSGMDVSFLDSLSCRTACVRKCDKCICSLCMCCSRCKNLCVC